MGNTKNRKIPPKKKSKVKKIGGSSVKPLADEQQISRTLTKAQLGLQSVQGNVDSKEGSVTPAGLDRVSSINSEAQSPKVSHEIVEGATVFKSKKEANEAENARVKAGWPHRSKETWREWVEETRSKVRPNDNVGLRLDDPEFVDPEIKLLEKKMQLAVYIINTLTMWYSEKQNPAQLLDCPLGDLIELPEEVLDFYFQFDLSSITNNVVAPFRPIEERRKIADEITKYAEFLLNLNNSMTRGNSLQWCSDAHGR